MSTTRTSMKEQARGLLRRIDHLKRGVKQRFGLFSPPEIVAFRGHGTSERLWLSGRLIEREGVSRSAEETSVWRKVVKTLRRMESDEIPGARLRARFRDGAWQATTDDEGYFQFAIEPERPLAAGWHEVEIELLDSIAGGAGTCATARALVPSAEAEFGVISDLDDTVIRTGATDRLTMTRTTLLNDAHTRVPFAGVAALYRALVRGPDDSGTNPIFYVSRSGWNLYHLLTTFLDVRAVPAGPLFLRDLAVVEAASIALGHDQDKIDRIRTLLETYPELPFVLIGDSGQHDPELYRRIAHEYPARIRAVYIRDVTTPERDREVREIAGGVREAGVPMVLVEETVEAAEHAAEHGLIPTAAVAEVRGDRDKEQEEGG